MPLACYAYLPAHTCWHQTITRQQARQHSMPACNTWTCSWANTQHSMTCTMLPSHGQRQGTWYLDIFSFSLPYFLFLLLQVQNLIEHCLQLYMNRGEVVRTLSDRARIEPGFTTLGEPSILRTYASMQSNL